MKFVIVINSTATVYLDTWKSVKPHVAGWLEQLNEYDYVIRRRPGSQMAYVDALIHAPCDERSQVPESEYDLEGPEELSAAAAYYTIPLEDKIVMIQSHNPELDSIRKILQKALRERHAAQESEVNEFKLRTEDGRA